MLHAGLPLAALISWTALAVNATSMVKCSFPCGLSTSRLKPSITLAVKVFPRTRLPLGGLHRAVPDELLENLRHLPRRQRGVKLHFHRFQIRAQFLAGDRLERGELPDRLQVAGLELAHSNRGVVLPAAPVRSQAQHSGALVLDGEAQLPQAVLAAGDQYRLVQ